jgi:hypothetical protein
VLISPEISDDKPIILKIETIGKYGLAIGIAPQNYNLENGIGIDSLSWGIGGSGRIWNAGVGKDYTKGFSKGDIIKVKINKHSGALSFQINDLDFQWAFEN